MDYKVLVVCDNYTMTKRLMDNASKLSSDLNVLLYHQRNTVVVNLSKTLRMILYFKVTEIESYGYEVHKVIGCDRLKCRQRLPNPPTPVKMIFDGVVDAILWGE